MILVGLLGASSAGRDVSVHALTEAGQKLSSSQNCCIDGNKLKGRHCGGPTGDGHSGCQDEMGACAMELQEDSVSRGHRIQVEWA